MKKQNKNIWVGAEEMNQDPELIKQLQTDEFFELPVMDALSDEERVDEATKGSSRRDFLKYMGFGLGAATIAASCEIPVKKGIPYVVKPDAIVPGIATYYASTYIQGGDVCPVVVKTREGRPIKIEGNNMSSMTNGGTSARVQASVLELYDTSRIKGPGKIKGEYNRQNPVDIADWAKVDKAIMDQLNAGSRIRIVANTIVSPTTKAAIAAFKTAYPNTEVVMYDAVSYSGMLMANLASFGEAYQALPSYRFDNAKTIVSIGADFLGTWVSPVEFANQYAKTRRIDDVNNASVSRLICFESYMSLTGSNADNRVMVRPSEVGIAIVALHNEVAKLAGGTSVSGGGNFAHENAANGVKQAAQDLWNTRGQGSLVVSGSNNVSEQILINNINNMLGAYGKTIDWSSPCYQRQGIDKNVTDLILQMNSGNVDAVFVMGDANPIYDLPDGDKFATGLKKAKLSVSFAALPNETMAACQFSCPDHHYLESWGDAEAKKGQYMLVQPTIQPLFDTRAKELTLLTWAQDEITKQGHEDAYYEFMQRNWESTVFGSQTKFQSFRSFWDSALHDGVVNADATETGSPGFIGDVSAAAGKVSKPNTGGIDVTFYETVNIGAGQFANNPWLQEMPDPLTRCVWDNFVLVNIKWDGDRRFEGFNGLKSGDLVDVTINGETMTMPAYIQFGQLENTCAIAVGYGRTVSGRAGTGVGKNVFPLLKRDADGNTQFYASDVSISTKKGTDSRFACVQYHHTMGVKVDGEGDNVDETALMTLGKGFQGSLVDRTVIRTSDISSLKKDVEDLIHEREHAQHLNDRTMYPGHDKFYKMGHHWGMNVDMNTCIGCGACQVACVAENNVPVVGKKEVNRHHEMTWMRIDRYFYGDVENPNVVYQPLMCQHCDNAPCENVCPVGATNHSSEGLNQMTYNRCIGTRYCANNCPYKVRRFNWLDYTTADLFPWNENDPMTQKPDLEEEPFYASYLTRMVLNPDVTVRSRGVIEKCSFCVQRIQEGKLMAKVENRPLRETDVVTACQSACPTNAITFGDLNIKTAKINRDWASPLNYKVLEEVNVQSSVGYTMKVTNKNEKIS